MPHALAVDDDSNFLSAVAEVDTSPTERAREEGRLGLLLGASPPMLEVYERLTRVARTDAPVLLTGESGTGKDLAARTLHLVSARSQGVFQQLDCGAVAPALIDGELFSVARGGPAGAGRLHRGYLERADGGTLLLDEVSALPGELQLKLLRVLETGELVRVCGERPQRIDVRLIAASGRDPREAAAEGRLREDLLYRLSVFPIHLPPLRERGDDVRLLAEHFLAALCREAGVARAFTPEAIERLHAHPWPGNVRELASVVHGAFLHADGEAIGPERLPVEIGGRPAPGRSLRFQVGASIAEIERKLILATLDCHDGNKRKAAEVLGVSLKTLYNRLNAYKKQEQAG